MAKQANLSVDKSDINRQLHGTAFLSLEHWAYMVLVVVVPILLIGGFQAALSIWSNNGMEPLMSLLMGGMAGHFFGNLAVTYAAALATTAPLLFVLQRRTEGELLKRPGYTQRVAYKLPIYGALAVLAVLKTLMFISLLAAFLQSLTMLGVKGADIGGLYLTQFLPSLLALLVFGAASVYLMKLAKGVNKSRQFAFAALWLSALMAVVLFTTAIMANHKSTIESPQMMPHSNSAPDWYR